MFEFNKNEPLWQQIIFDIQTKIASGYYTTGTQIESVRELASIYGVNPNTIVKSLSVLEDKGILKTERGIGKFVDMDEAAIEEMKIELASRLIQNVVKQCKAMGVDQILFDAIAKKEYMHE